MTPKDQLMLNLMHRAVDVLEDFDCAFHWLNTPRNIFNDLSPIEHAEASDEGYAYVMTVLGRIEHGVFS